MTEVREGYKKTEVGVIPVEWEVVKLDDISKITMGQSPKSDTYNTENIGMPLVQGNADCKNRKTIPRTYTTELTKECFVGDIIMTVRAPVGAISKSLHNACIGRGVCSIKSKEDNEYIYHYLVDYEDKWDKLSQGSTFTAVSGSDIKNIKLPLPSLKEQEKIADILSTADEKIDAIEGQIQKAETLKKGLLQKLLSEGIGHSEFKDSELGKIPVGWEVKSLSMIGSFSKGKGISKNEIVENGIPCMRYAEIYTDYDTVLKNIKSFINEKSALNSKRLLQGDILFAGSGETLEDIGKSVAFVDDFEAYAGGDTVILSPTTKYNSLFMAYQLNATLVRLQLRKLGQGSSVVHIYSSGLEKVKVPFPPIEEQKEIAHILSTADDKIEVLRSKKEKYETLKQGLMQRLLSGEVRVTV